MKKIAVMFSGGGTDFQALIDGQAQGLFDGEIVVSITSNPNAYGRERAKKAGIDCFVCKKSDFASDVERDKKVVEILQEYGAELVVLAGYLGIVTEPLFEKYDGRMINIHPALLPKFGGKGMYGMNVHNAVIAAGEKKSGATVHYVDRETDTGEIIIQRALDVLPTDTPETLQKRILEDIEHPLLVEAVSLLCAKDA